MSTSQEKKLPSNRTYTVDDIAAILGIAKSTAYRLVNSGEFKTIRIGYAIRISKKSFEDWLKMEEPEEMNGFELSFKSGERTIILSPDLKCVHLLFIKR